MTGNEAAEIVREACLRKRHTVGRFDEPLVCEHCREVAERLRDRHREEPVPPALLVHIAVDVESGRVVAFTDEAEAVAAARKRNGVVVSMPVSSDWREAT